MHISETYLIIAWPLNKDSEHSKFISIRNIFISLFPFHHPLPFVNIKEQKFTGFTLAIVVVWGLESERVL